MFVGTQNPVGLRLFEPTPEEPLRRGGAQGGSGQALPTGSPTVGSRASHVQSDTGQHRAPLRLRGPR